MAASDEIKEAIVHYFNATNAKGSTEKDWKRLQKRTLANGEVLREFHCAKLNRTVYTIGEDEDAQILEKDNWLYGVYHIKPGEEMMPGFGSMSISFEPQSRWERQRHLYDQHQEWVLENLFPDFPQISEDTENSFSYEDTDYNNLTIHMALKRAGFTHSQEITDFLNNGTSYPPIPPQGPTNPPLPPLLDPNYTPAAKPAAKAAPAPTSSGAVKLANKMPAQVAAATQANLHAQQQAMMASIGQMAAQLGATGGVTIGKTHIPAAPLMPGMRPLMGTPALPPSAVMASPGMQAAMPLMAGQYPELVNLQTAVQAAFIAQRILGLQGLQQDNPNWMDKDDVEKLLMRHRNTSFTLDIERSNAIWMLYEITDDGSGNPLEDFFAIDNEELYDTLDSYGILDQIDDEHDVVIVDDLQAYNPPFDLPVPQPQPAPPMPGGMGGGGGRPAPMVGPASINTRSGSFAPLQAAPAAVAPPAPPPGNAAAHISNDSGDKWAEFCREVWDTYEANKTNLPLDLDWYDRYRPREAQITGLGFHFVRREFTGIRVMMGYLGRDGELIDNIDLPSAVLGELLVEWGGDWNVDDITQDIHKRKGENPETGFSYSSEATWEEVRTHLLAQGWTEVA